MLTLTIRDDGIGIQPESMPSEKSAILVVSGVTELASGVMPLREFALLGEKILQWSDRQQPACRFDIIFVDEATQKKPYADALKAIDRVFYKSMRTG